MKKPRIYEGPCPECGEGTIKPTRFQNYKATIRGYPFVVPEAWIGVCDSCGTRTFNAKETHRWATLFEQTLESHHAYLAPEDITQLRESLGLSKKDFAHLIGATGRSLYTWEAPDRKTPPSRSADLILKIVRATLQQGRVDAIDLLLDEVKKWGLELEVRREVANE